MFQKDKIRVLKKYREKWRNAKIRVLSKKYNEKCQNTENTEKMPKYRANIKIQSNRELCYKFEPQKYYNILIL